MNSKLKGGKGFLFVFVYIFIGVISGILLSANLKINPEITAETKEIKTSSDYATAGFETIENSFVKIAEEVGPAVVSITTVQTKKVGRQRNFSQSPFGGNDFFNKFFGDYFGSMPEREYKQSGLGSGVIIDKRGYILTNEHVIGNADEVTVTLPDNREFKAEIMGTDPRSDLAVIKINAKNLPIARLGDSDEVKTGQWAVAIGNPFGFYLKSSEPTVTTGVISALHRQLPHDPAGNRLYIDLIQTDAAINPGNSGGPLVNLKGEVIGINVAIFSSSGGYQGLGFAIPINTAKFILNKLIKGEDIEYSWLGVTVQDVTHDLTEYFNLKSKKGAIVIKILPDSPAEKAGIKEDDIIVEYNGKKIDNYKKLINLVSHTNVGENILVKVLREGKEITLTVKTSKRPDKIAGPGEPIDKFSNNWKGIETAGIDTETAKKFGYLEGKGVIVVKVEKGSGGYWAGIKTGDAIYSINKQSVNSVDDFNKVTKSIKRGETAFIRTNRGYITLKSND
ncbi:MAG: Do family serine endopeptidase [Candidatus Omnitrophica bacterium]|nr:Do family serine endopeptidase [Candidatus Omnitrophota bacterium]